LQGMSASEVDHNDQHSRQPPDDGAHDLDGAVE
jgi:hypothetical protein